MHDIVDFTLCHDYWSTPIGNEHFYLMHNIVWLAL